jgi:hypothetical protein
VNVSNSGGGRGAFPQNGASIAMTGGSVTTSGSGTYGFLFQAPTGVVNTLTLNGTQVTSAADAFAVQGGTANITAANATVVGNNGVLLSATENAGAPAVVTMTAGASELTGAILTDAASRSTVTLSSGTTWNMTGFQCHQFHQQRQHHQHHSADRPTGAGAEASGRPAVHNAAVRHLADHRT